MNFPFILSKNGFILYSHINTFCLFEKRILLHTLNLRSPCFNVPSSGTSAVFYHAQPSFSICVCLLFHPESISHICPKSGFSNQMLSILYMLHKRFIWSFHSWRMHMLICWFKSSFLTLEIETEWTKFLISRASCWNESRRINFKRVRYIFEHVLYEK